MLTTNPNNHTSDGNQVNHPSVSFIETIVIESKFTSIYNVWDSLFQENTYR